jgi:hypothetical protein
VLPYAAVAYLDFLGFGEMVEQDSQLPEPVHLPLILEPLDVVEQRVGQAGLSLTQFSDSIVVAAPFTPESVGSLVSVVQMLQRLLVERGILVRGGIAIGPHYADGGRMFSKALVAAYKLESTRARYPRVLADTNLLDWCLNHPKCSPALDREIRSHLMRDRDGAVFIHYLDAELLPDHARIVVDTLERGQKGDTSILAKAHWLVDYHEHVASTGGADGLDEHLAARFQSFSNS